MLPLVIVRLGAFLMILYKVIRVYKVEAKIYLYMGTWEGRCT